MKGIGKSGVHQTIDTDLHPYAFARLSDARLEQRIESKDLCTGHFRTSIAMVMERKKRSNMLENCSEEPVLSATQSKALASLMAGRNYLEAAADAGVSDRSIRRWRESCPAFELALRQQIQEVRDSAAISASLASQTVVKTLVEIASTPDHPLVLRAIQLLSDLSGPLTQPKSPTSVNDIEDEMRLAMVQRLSSRGY
jgi:hypothetical protein